MPIIITRIEKKNFCMTDLYFLLLKKNLENIELANGYYLYYYLLVYFIYLNKQYLITYNELKLSVSSHKIGSHNLLLSTTQNTRPSHCTSTFCLSQSFIFIEYPVMSSFILAILIQQPIFNLL